MSKEIWKWVLTQQSEDRLSEIVNVIKAEIPGFRKGSKLPPNKIIIMNLMKPQNLQKLAKSSISVSEQFNNINDIPKMSMEELKSINDIPPSLVLMKLLTENKEDKAISLFQHWRETYKEEDLLKIEQDCISAIKEQHIQVDHVDQLINEPIKEDTGKELKKLEKMNKKLEQKIKKLHGELDFSNMKYKKQLVEQEEKKKIRDNEYQQLQAEYVQLQKNYNTVIEEFEIEKVEWKKNELSFINEISQLQKEMKKIEISTYNQKSEIEIQDKKAHKKIYLLGNPHNQSIFINCPIEVKIVERSEIDTVDFDDCQEIWGLTYKLDSQIINNLQIETGKSIKKIEIFEQLKKELEKGLEKFEKQKMGS